MIVNINTIMTSEHTNINIQMQPLYDLYKTINESDLISKKTVNIKNVTDYEKQSRSVIQMLYRKNPTNFCRYLIKSRLSHLILWTEAKCIVKYFGLIGIVYITWDEKYICNIHRNIDNQSNKDNIYKSNDTNEKKYSHQKNQQTKFNPYKHNFVSENLYDKLQNVDLK
jgi:hypothetical protein